MKTAEEWAETINNDANEKGGFDTVNEVAKWISKVQADAKRDVLTKVIRDVTAIENDWQIVGASAKSDGAQYILTKLERKLHEITD